MNPRSIPPAPENKDISVGFLFFIVFSPELDDDSTKY
jgi:hypothetical protein